MKRWAVSFIFTLFFTGCIQTDLSNCPSEVVIDFEYIYNTQEADLLNKEVKTIALFVFDHNNKFVMRKDHDITSGNATITFDLDQGMYQFVAWGNLDEHYEEIHLEPNISTSNDLMVSLRHENNQVKQQLSLFHAQLTSEKVERLGLKKKMSFIKNSNTITVTLNYPNAPQQMRSDDSLGKFSLNSTNGTMNASNQTQPEVGFRSYLALSAKNTAKEDIFQTTIEFSTLQLATDQPILFNASPASPGTTDQLFEYDLMEVINQTPIDLTKEDSYQVIFNFNSANISTIYVNGWEVINNNGDIGIE
ncbi:MAG: FimB/Mfa2 family fimbrial subunit [Tannerellaceae bacterium]